MDKELRQEYREYAWKYFELHADQRLKAFHFFIIFATLLIGAFATLLQRSGLQLAYVLLPLSLMFLSFVFWKLEERTRMLVKNGEDALKYLDAEALRSETVLFQNLALFDADDRNVEELRNTNLWHDHFSYSRCFRWVYISAGALGVLGVLICFVGT